MNKCLHSLRSASACYSQADCEMHRGRQCCSYHVNHRTEIFINTVSLLFPGFCVGKLGAFFPGLVLSRVPRAGCDTFHRLTLESTLALGAGNSKLQLYRGWFASHPQPVLTGLADSSQSKQQCSLNCFSKSFSWTLYDSHLKSKQASLQSGTLVPAEGATAAPTRTSTDLIQKGRSAALPFQPDPRTSQNTKCTVSLEASGACAGGCCCHRQEEETKV